MKTGLSALAAAAALGLAAPVGAQTGMAASAQLAPGEVLLHISARGTVPADYATVETSLSAQAPSKEEAEALLREIEQGTVSALAQVGIDRSRIEIGEAKLQDYEDYDWAASAMDDAAAAAEEAADAAVAEAEAIAEVVDVPYEEQLVTRWNATSTMTVTVDDLAKLDQVLQAAPGDVGAPRPRFRFRDEARSERLAIANALAEARADAEAYADALGYRVVRIVAVSNQGAEFDAQGFFQTLVGIDTLSREWTVFGSKTAPIAVDFVIAPQ
jgi:uncharacterized protein